MLSGQTLGADDLRLGESEANFLFAFPLQQIGSLFVFKKTLGRCLNGAGIGGPTIESF